MHVIKKLNLLHSRKFTDRILFPPKLYDNSHYRTKLYETYYYVLPT